MSWPRLEKAQREEKHLYPAGPMPHTTTSLLLSPQAWFVFRLSSAKKDPLSGKAFLSVMLVMNRLV